MRQETQKNDTATRQRFTLLQFYGPGLGQNQNAEWRYAIAPAVFFSPDLFRLALVPIDDKWHTCATFIQYLTSEK